MMHDRSNYRNAEKIVSNFYNTVGWVQQSGITEDARRFEDLRGCAENYVSMCRLRVLRHIPPQGELILDMASGPIQFPEYLKYSRNFKKRYCVDLSTNALIEAEKKIGQHGIFLNKSFFDIDFEDDKFDCAISLHTIYHIEESLQEQAVRKLIRVTKVGKPIIIVYSNPSTILDILSAQKLRHWVRCVLRKKSNQNELYFSPHSIDWWNRFEDVSEVKILPWRSFTRTEQRILFPDNKLGKRMFKYLYQLEEWFPNLFARYFRYPMIVLTKKALNKA